MRLQISIGRVIGIWLCVVFCTQAYGQAALDLTKLTRLSSEQAAIATSFKSFNRGTKESLYALSLRNVTASSLHGPLYVTIEGVNPPSVTVKNPSGLTTSGVPYFVVSASDLAGGAEARLELVFHNPFNVRFSFNPVGFATPDSQSTPALQLEITQPGTLITVGSTPLAIEGRINDASAALTVNGVPITHAGGTFRANVALVEGHNAVVARASNARGQEATATISASLDLTPPFVTIDSPVEGAVVSSALLSVSGLINDIVRGTVSEGQATVTVNGRPASVANRSYLAQDIALAEGPNTIRVEAADQVGNLGAAQVQVRYEVPSGEFIELVSGQAQQAQIRQVLAQSLQVKLVKSGGQPVGNKPVVFRVSQGEGVVGVGGSDEGAAVLVMSDDNGLASTRFKLGARAGSGNQRVTARAVGFAGEVVFFASATPKSGDKVSVNSGHNQRGAAEQPLPLPFVIVVTDDGANVIEGAEVEFEVTAGSGVFQNGANRILATTDSDGRASAKLTLGEELGLDVHRVNATLVGSEVFAGFTASALQSGPPGATSISGVVLDNQDRPLPNVTLRVEGTSREAKSDEAGRFRISEAPVGPVRLIADGSTTTVPGEWPSLPYNIVTVSGADNPLAAPVYLVKLDTAHAVTVGAEDKEITLPEVPGFKLTVKAGSVTFPNADRVGQLSVTPVNVSKIPMLPPNGMQPQFIVTIQPTGARFDPPAPLQLPNVDGHPPGAQVEMYSFDHDLEEFVAIGLGTVSADGTVIASNNGVGVIKAGWHCGSQPGGDGCVAACPICQTSRSTCGCVAAPNGLLAATNVTDPRPPGDIPNDCKQPICENGTLQQVPDPEDDPLDTSPGDCRSPKCFEDPVPNDRDEPLDGCRTCANGEVVDLQINDVTTLVNGLDEAILLFKPGGVTLSFTSNVETSSGCEVEYEWDFGDGATGSEPNPIHTFTAAGQYSAILRVKCAGCAATERSHSIDVILPTVELVTPKGDAATTPIRSGAGRNHFKYTSSFPGILFIDFVARVSPDNIDIRRISNHITFFFEPVGQAFPTWDVPANPGGRGTVFGHTLLARARIDGLPLRNADFGNKLAELKFNDVTIETSTTRVFYDALAKNHPGGVSTDPNWFYYYKDQERRMNPSGIDYTYDGTLTQSHTVVEGPIFLTDDCYNLGNLFDQAVVGGRRRFLGLGAETQHWRSFLRVLAHERAHAETVRLWPSEQDPDGDLLSSAFETGTASTDPNERFSCDPGTLSPGERLDDAECWASGPPEHEAVAGADIRLDWAQPGSQWTGEIAGESE